MDPVEIAERELAKKKERQKKFRLVQCQNLDEKSMKLLNHMKNFMENSGPAWENTQEESKDNESDDEEEEEKNAFEEATAGLSSRL